MEPRIWLIAGPTASGKSALALRLAQEIGAEIVNGDALQLYADLRLLTARPSIEEETLVPHHLFGTVDAADGWSVGRWLRAATSVLDEIAARGRPAVVVGGTGLYFRALTEGLSEMPEIPRHVRDRWRYHLIEDGVARLHHLLMRRDPEAAMRIRKTDSQRVVRALEVLDSSGRSILQWQAMRDEPLVDLDTARAAVLEVPRDLLVERIGRRFDEMVENGAIAEVEALLARKLGDDMPAMKAIGVREFRAVLEGTESLDAAIERAKIATRQYAKRQATWFRHQLGPEWKRVDPATLNLTKSS